VPQANPADNQNDSVAIEARSPATQQQVQWNATPLNRFGPFVVSTRDTSISLCISGIQIAKRARVMQNSAKKVLQQVTRIPYSAVADVKIVNKEFKAMNNVFEIDLKSGQAFQFKGNAAVPFAKKIKEILEHPQLAANRGIKGTPSQIRGKGITMNVFGIILFACAVLVLYFMIQLLYTPTFLFSFYNEVLAPIFLIFMLTVIGVFLVLHSRTFFKVAREAKVNEQNVQ
jgi:hypothetical protein